MDDYRVHREDKFILEGQARTTFTVQIARWRGDGSCEVFNQTYLLFSWSGELPYPDITTPSALISFLSSGKRMPRPDHCCEEM